MGLIVVIYKVHIFFDKSFKISELHQIFALGAPKKRSSIGFKSILINITVQF